MKKRYLEILHLLNDAGFVTSQEIASLLSLSSKTIQKTISEMEEILHDYGVSIEVRHRKGYRLIIDNPKAYAELLEKYSDVTPMSTEERTEYILRRLAEATDYLRLSDLEEELYVSRGSLQQCMKQVDEILERNFLSLERKPRYGIKIEGPEFFKRRFLSGYFEKKTLFSERDNEELLELISKSVKEPLRHAQFSLSDFALSNLIIHLYIAVERIENNMYIEKETLDIDELSKSHEYQIAQMIVSELEKNLNLKFPEPEIAYVTIHLAGKRIQNENQISNIVIHQHIVELVSEIIEVIYQKMQMDFRGDVELQMSLGLHLVALETRVKYMMDLKNPLLADVKKGYPVAYTMAVEASAILNSYFNTRISDHEVGYIAFSFALAMERLEQAFPKKNILLVCATGKGSAKLLKYKYEKEFAGYIESLVCCDVNELSDIDFTNIDYVITTVPITINIPRPILEVQYFLDAKEISELRSTLFEDDDNSVIEEYYDEDLFIPNLQARTREEVIEKLCNHIAKYRNVPESFKQLVFDREASARTEFGNFVAMPHPNENIVDSTFVCIAILDSPIIWEEKKVQVIFLIAIEKDLKKSIQKFYQATASFLLNKESIKGLIKTRDFKWFLSRISQQEE